MSCTESIINIKAMVAFQSSLDITDLGKKISKIIFGDIPFEGLEAKVYDEVPAVFFRKNLFGLEVVLNGYSGFGESERFYLSLSPNHRLQGDNEVNVDLSDYLYRLLVRELTEEDIRVYKPGTEYYQ